MAIPIMSKRKSNTHKSALQSTYQGYKDPTLLAKLLIALVGISPVFLPLMGNRPELDMITGLLIGFGVILTFYLWSGKSGLGKSDLGKSESKKSGLQAQKGQSGIQLLLHPLVIVCLALWGWALLSALWSVNLFEWFHKILFLTTAILGLILAQQLINHATLIQFLYKSLFISGVAIAIIGICQHLFHLSWFQQAAPPAATFGNKNMAMHYILLTIGLGVVQFWQCRKTVESWFFAIGITLMMTFIVYSTTRAAWIAVTIQGTLLTVYAVWEYRKHSEKLGFETIKIKIGLACSLLWLLMVHMTDAGFNRHAIVKLADDVESIAVESTLQSESANARWALYANSLLIVRDHPLLGVGFGNWKLTYPIYQQQLILDKLTTEHNQPLKLHNDIIEYTSELGLIGLFIILLIALLLLYCLGQILSKAAINDRLLGIGAFVSLIGIVVDAQFSFPMQLPLPLTVTMLMVSVLATLSIVNAHQTSDQRTLQWWFAVKRYHIPAFLQKPLSLFVLLLTVASSWLLYCWHHSDQAWQRAKVAEQKLDFDGIIQHANESLYWLPWRQEAYFFIAFANQHQGKHHEALALYDQLLTLYPNSSSAQLRAAQSAMLSNQPEKAKDVLDQLIRNRPYSAEAHKHQGLLYYNYLNDKGKGVDYFERTLELDADTGQAQQLGNIVRKYRQRQQQQQKQ